MKRGFAALPLWFFCACGQPEGSVGLDFAETSNGRVRGFDCSSESSMEFLWNRAQVPGGRTTAFSLVIDFVDLGGQPDCRASQLFDWCEAGSCETLFSLRKCFPMRFASQNQDSLVQLQTELDALSGREILADAPDSPILIRAIGTTLSCDEALAVESFPCGSLVGCLHSCPSTLDAIDGNLLLDLDTVDRRCESEVQRCASPSLTTANSCSGS